MKLILPYKVRVFSPLLKASKDSDYTLFFLFCFVFYYTLFLPSENFLRGENLT